MQRIRTFYRSKTPTPEDMKSQRSLEVPKQVRSASFDEMKLEASRSDGAAPKVLLAVPHHGSRSRSVDSAGSEDSGKRLEVPKSWYRRRSSKSLPPPCVHCRHVKTWEAQNYERIKKYERFRGCWSTDDDEEYDSEESRPRMLLAPPQSPSPPPIVVLSPTRPSRARPPPPLPFCALQPPPPPPRTLLPPPPPLSPPPFPPPPLPKLSPPPTAQVSPPAVFSPPPAPGTPSFELQPPSDEPPTTSQRRRSISRQEAFHVDSTGSSLESVRAPETAANQVDPDSYVHDIYLAVPEMIRGRAASVDSSITKARAEELSVERDYLSVPGNGVRSRSVDIVLPTAKERRYKALASSPTSTSYQDQVPARNRRGGGDSAGAVRVLRSTPDWTDAAVNGEHLWSPLSPSSETCYVGEALCHKRYGPRMTCSACKVTMHMSCIDILMDRFKFTCKSTFRDVGIRQYREQTLTHHHWVHRKTEKGKCKACGKVLQSKLSFSTKEIVALDCSWCKAVYHNKENCFDLQRIGEECDLGDCANIIVPPSWIVKLPRKGSFKSSLRKTPKKKTVSKKKSKDSKTEQKTFVIKPIPIADVTPVLVFINPKSGGNQGTRLLQTFQWLLNPRQVFDLTQGGPGPGLELFRKVPNLRVLACGGDGTAGWVLSVLDRMGIHPAVGVLPLGTGNDLARALGWGGGYEDEPISKILTSIAESDMILLDRWQVTVKPNPAAAGQDLSRAKLELPLNVVNNYFSFGVDAHIALEFHEAREAHPERFNSRIRNKLFYGTAGGKDLMRRKWKGLAELVTVECDGKDFTPTLKEHRVHAIVFLNIPSYGGGTRPWNKSAGAHEPSTDDGLIEVVGLTTYQLPLLQAGGHGTPITQCKTAKIVTTKVIPMQVDGEACRLGPSIITISRLNQATLLAKRKPGRPAATQAPIPMLSMTVYLLNMTDYEQYSYDKEILAGTAEQIGVIQVIATAYLEDLRGIIQKMLDESQAHTNLKEWWFIDWVTTERFFRIDRAQEHLHYPADIGHDNVYILEPMAESSDSESAVQSVIHTGSLDRTGPSASLDTTIGQSFSLDISQSADTPSADHSLDVPESHTAELGLSIPPSVPEEPVSPTASSPPPEAGSSTSPPLAATSTLKTSSPQPGTSAEGHQPSPDSIERFKTNLLEKRSDSLLKAAKVGDLKMMKELHVAGYSLLSIDATGQTALHIAARYGNKEIVKYLIGYAPNTILNMRDNERGQTALHKAAAHKRRAICCMLVAGGASLTHQDHAGLTPRHLALRVEDHDLAAYLETQEKFQIAVGELETPV